MTTTFPLDLKFKGDRDYLHGTDILTALEEIAGPLENFTFLIRKVMKVGQVAIVMPADGMDAADLSASVIHGPEGRQLGVMADPTVTVEGRYAYDEADVISGATFEGDGARLPARGDHRFIEQIVALNKALVRRLVAADRDWFFTKLEMRYMPVSPTPIRLRLVQRLGTRLTKSAIEVAGEEVGFIYFSASRQ